MWRQKLTCAFDRRVARRPVGAVRARQGVPGGGRGAALDRARRGRPAARAHVRLGQRVRPSPEVI